MSNENNEDAKAPEDKSRPWLHLKNAHKVECSAGFPPIASSAQMRISKIQPRDSAVLIYTPALGDNPIRFNGPETEADVPVAGHEMYAQPILGCEEFQIDFLGWIDPYVGMPSASFRGVRFTEDGVIVPPKKS
jgi:hypothetical protein